MRTVTKHSANNTLYLTYRENTLSVFLTKKHALRHTLFYTAVFKQYYVLCILQYTFHYMPLGIFCTLYMPQHF